MGNPRRFVVWAMLVLVLFVAGVAHAGWSDEPADLTVGEYLELWFTLDMVNKADDLIASYNLVSFYPGWSPDSAIVVITQTWRDDLVSQVELRRAIRQRSDAAVKLFESSFRLPHIKRRWPATNPKANLIIKHVRYEDIREVLAVTINGITSFDSADFEAAEARVLLAGGVWSW